MRHPAQLLTARGLTMALALLVALLAATNRYADWTVDAPLVQYAASDGNSYRAIALAFPGLPADGAGLVHHHAQRFPVAWTVGAVAEATGMGVDAAFRLLVVAALLGALALLARALAALQVAPLWRLLLLALFILAPLSTRFYVAFPWIAPDAVFLVGAALVGWGLATDRARLLLGGILVAAVARQTGLLLVPALAAWAALASWPRATSGRAGLAAGEAGRRWLVAGVGAAIAVGAYLITDRASTPFSAASMNADTVTGLFTWLGDQPSLGGLASFLSRGVLALALPAVLLAWLLRGASPAARWRAVPLLVAAGLVALQPVLGGPAITGNNLARLALLGLPFLLVAMGALMADQAERLPVLRPVHVAVLLGALAAGSQHHITSLVGRDDSSWAPAFAALTLLCDAVILAVLWWAARAGRRGAPGAPATPS